MAEAMISGLLSRQVMPPGNVPYTLDAIAGSQVRWIERCGHLPMVEHPDEYAAILREFLSGAQFPRATREGIAHS